MTPSLDGEPDSDDLNDIIDTPAPPDIPYAGPPTTGNFIDTDQVLILNRADTSQGKFHYNLIDLHIADNLGSSSSTFLSVDAAADGIRTILGSLIYYAFDARQGSFVSGARNFTLRLDWISSTGQTQAGISAAKTRGYIGQPNDSKNVEVTAIFRIRNLPNEQVSHHDASIKARGGDSHTATNEKTLQAGGRMPYTTKGRHNSLYGVEYTHPSYQYENVTFVSPYSSSNYPLITVDQWFGMKFVIYNVNNNQTVHAEMWVDPSPINTAQNGYNNNWQKVWVYEQSGSQAPTWSGPNCQFKTNLAQDVDVIAYNIHEIIPPTTTSSIFSAVELAERAEFEESTGMRHPIWIEQMEEPIDESNNTTQEVPPTIGILEDNIDAVGDYVPEKTDFLVPETTLKPVKKSIESEPKEAFYDDGDDTWEP